MADTSSRTKKIRQLPRRFASKLKSIYYDVKNPASFSSPYLLYKAARVSDRNIRLKDVLRWLETQETYTLNRRAVRKFHRRKILVPNVNDQWQADIAYFHQFKSQNRGYMYFLVVVDCFSRFGYISVLKNKSSESVTKAFLNIMKVSHDKPKWLQTDLGTEFYGAKFETMLIRNDIFHFSTSQPAIKCSMAERFILTIRKLLKLYFTANQTKTYMNVLPDLLFNYNNSPHSSLGGFTPSQASKRKNWARVYEIQYSDYLRRRKKAFKFQENDKVRISLTKETFSKSHKISFSNEIYTVVHCLDTQPPSYYVMDKKSVLLQGAFYEPELQRVRQS